MRRALAIAIVLSRVAHADSKDDGEVKLSMPTESDRQAWLRPGFRLSLDVLYGDIVGLRGVPSGRALGAGMHAGLRLDADWSLFVSFNYSRISDGVSGFRFEGTVDPTWHITRAFSVAVGVGLGGLVNGRTNGNDINPLPNTIDSSYTYSSSNPPLPLCSGTGLVGVLRAQYAWVLGPRAAFNLEAEMIGNYIECVDPTGRTEPDTAQPIVRTQYWPMTGGTLAVGITWR